MRKIKTTCLRVFLLGILFSMGSAIAQTGNRMLSGKQLVFRNWDNQSGLPQNTVNDIVMDQGGYLWVATEEGLIRFDGAVFTVKNEANTPGLYSGTFYDLALSGEGLWAAARNTILHISNNSVRSYDLRTYLRGSWIKCIGEDAKGVLWIGTSSGSLFYLQGDSVMVCPSWKQGAKGPIEVLRMVQGRMMVGTTRGLFALSSPAGPVTPYGQFAGIHITAMAGDGKDQLWVGTADEGVFSLFGNRLQLSTKEGLKETYINSLAIAPGGDLWIGTRSSGFQVYADGRLSSPDQNKYAHVGIRSIFVTEGGLAWLGTTSSGLLQVNPAQVQMAPPHLKLSNSIVLPIYQHPNGDIWVGTAGKGLNRIVNQKATAFTTANGLSSDLVLALHGTRDHVFIGTSNGLQRFSYKTGRFDRIYTKKDGLTSNYIIGLFQDTRKRLWISSRHGGIQFLENNKIDELAVSAEIASSHVIAIHEDRQGNMWFGSRGAGMVRLDEHGALTHFNQKKGFPADIVYCFYEDSDGALWMGTDKGLVCFSGNRFSVFNKELGLRFNEIYRIMDDGAGFLWLSGNFGLQRVGLAHLGKARSNSEKGVPLEVRLFNTVDGMANAETNGGIFPAGWKMKDGTLWFPTVQGVAIVDPLMISEEEKNVNIHIQSVHFADKEFSSFEQVDIPPNVYNIEINYSSIDYLKAGDINYHYRLKGLSNEWVPAHNRRTAYFSGLLPGRYTFEVKAEQYGKWSPTAALYFTVKPYFYQTVWFKGLLILLLTGVVLMVLFALKKKVQHKLLEQQKINKAHINGQEKERQLIGSELHDNINQQLTTVKLYLNLARVSEEMRLQMIERSEQALHNVINEIRSLCKSLTPPTLKDIGLPEALEELVGSYRVIGKFALHYTCSARLDELEEEISFSLFRITQEQLNNITRHAEAKNVWINFVGSSKFIYLVIRDDGKGFHVEQKSRGVGLTNIRNRVELYHGSLEIVSAPGEGCTLKIAIPLKTSNMRIAFQSLVHKRFKAPVREVRVGE